MSRRSQQSEFARLRGVSDGWSSKTGANASLITYRYRCLKPHFKGKTCLELGSADGQMTQFLLEDFELVMAVDGSERFIKHLGSLHNPRLLTKCCLFEQFETKQKFDTVLLAHILEHVDDPIGVIRIGKKHLAEDGALLIDVPNADSFHRLAGVKMGLLDKKDDLNETDLKLGHRRVYTVELMRRHIEEAGLSIEHWGGCFLKTVSNAQMEESWTREMMDAYFELGREFPRNAAEIYFVLNKRDNSRVERPIE